MLVAVGGGGLIGGMAAYFAGDVKVIGVEPELCADAARTRSTAGDPVDVPVGGIAADSLGGRRIGELLLPDRAEVHRQRRAGHRRRHRRRAERCSGTRCASPSNPAARRRWRRCLPAPIGPAPGERVGVLLCGANTGAVTSASPALDLRLCRDIRCRKPEAAGGIMAKRAFTFPGQGSQAVGMGKDLAEAYPEARAVFDEVDEALAQNSRADHVRGAGRDPAADRECPAGADGGEPRGGARARGQGRRRSRITPRSSPATRSASIRRSAPRARSRWPTRRGCCESAARRCSRRCRSGRAPWRRSSGSICRRCCEVAAEAAQGEVCGVANDNAPGQVVISGHKAAVERAMEIAKAKGAKRALPLPVSAPFHCALMRPAADAMARGARRGRDEGAGRAGGRQCAGAADHRSGRDPQAAGRAGDRHGALDRERRLARRARAA